MSNYLLNLSNYAYVYPTHSKNKSKRQSIVPIIQVFLKIRFEQQTYYKN